MRETLIPKGLTKELKESQFTKIVIPATKEYRLTDKGINIAKHVLQKQ